MDRVRLRWRERDLRVQVVSRSIRDLVILLLAIPFLRAADCTKE